MDRRNIFKSLLTAGVGLIAATCARAEAPRATKVVYHLADAEKVSFVLGNLRNHLAGAGGSDAIKLAVAVHGPALRAFHRNETNVAIREDMQGNVKAGVEFFACAHTMAAQKWALDDLLPGFVVAEKGAVVLLADLQAQGWAYLRP
jgi:intracellular sulfur oxidation DsrE/DsrF family protein